MNPKYIRCDNRELVVNKEGEVLHEGRADDFDVRELWKDY